jgi:hypothetical protein
MSRADVEAAYPGWKVADEEAHLVVALRQTMPWFLKKLGVEPHCYRLRRE